MAAEQATIGVFVSLTLGLLFNAEAVMRTAESQPVGWRRSVAVGLMKPVVAVSDFLGLTVPRATLDRALREEAGEETEIEIADPPLTTVADPLADARAAQGMVVMGDSMANDLSTPLTRDVEALGVAPITTEYKAATGLARPDELNWPAKATKFLEKSNPQVVVVQFGGNDGQGMTLKDETVLDFGTEAWKAEYARRVGVMMDVVSGSWQRPVVWVGLPIPRSAALAGKFEILNSVYESEAEKRANVTFVDIYRTFAGEEGEYADYLPDETGKETRMRKDDGIHMTLDGAQREAAKVFPAVQEALAGLAARLGAPPPTAAPATAPASTRATTSAKTTTTKAKSRSTTTTKAGARDS